MNETELKEIHEKSIYHRKIIEQGNLCGCFYCRKTFTPLDIKEWTDGNDTALCPKCGIDSVIPLDDKVDNTALLEELSVHWFNLEYRDGKLAHK